MHATSPPDSHPPDAPPAPAGAPASAAAEQPSLQREQSGRAYEPGPLQARVDEHPGAVEVGEGRAAWGRWVRLLAIAIAAALAAVLATNLLVDPRGVVGTGIWRPLVSESGARTATAAALAERAQAPGVLVVGSSTARNVDPATVERVTGREAYNAAVPAGRPIDALALSRIAAERPGGERMDLAWIVDVDGMWLDQRDDAALVLDRRLRRALPARDLPEVALEALGSYLTLDALEQSARVVAADPLARRAPADAADAFDEDGFRSEDPYAGQAPERLERRLREEGQALQQRVYGAGNEPDELGADARRHARALLADVAGREGGATIVVPPVHPDYRELVGEHAWDERRDAVLAELRAAIADTGADSRVVDLTATDLVDADDFHDHLHLTRAATDRLLAAALADPDGEAAA